MIESGAIAWMQFLLLILLGSAAGYAFARFLPLEPSPVNTLLRLGIGLSAAPFLVGLASVVTLATLRGAEPAAQYVCIVALLLGTTSLAAAAGHRTHVADPPIADAFIPKVSALDWSLIGVIVIAALVLIVHALFIPLVQNDSLEYLLSGRRLYETRDLAAYPPIDSAHDPAGFYGPWTHPPLYPALIHASLLCDGMVDMPGLMRLIAPWALLASTLLVVALGTTVNRRTGLVAGALYLTTPLLFLGAESALLDSLSAAAFLLVLALVARLDPVRPIAPVFLGVTLGLVMWAHSQMILLCVICVVSVIALADLRSFRGIRRAATILGVALPICIWPFLDNFLRVGSLVSDNPAVFALAQQDWPGYFRAERDLLTLTSRIQYGIFKGWHAIEAYGLSFWLMLPSLVAVIPIILRRPSLRHISGMASNDVRAVAGLFFGIYFAGLCLSVALGVDLMIKTERYLLMTMSAVAILAGSSVARLERLQMSGIAGRFAGAFAVALLSGFLLVQILAFVGYRMRTFALSPWELNLPLAVKLERWAPYRAMTYLRESTPPASLVLTLKPSDLFYAQRRMLSFLDPSLIPAYGETTAVAFADRLHHLGITHVHIPDYPLPPLYRSQWETMLADDRLATLLADHHGHQIYSLRRSGSKIRCASWDALNPAWMRSTSYTFGGRKRLAFTSQHSLATARREDADASLPLWFQREVVTQIASAPQVINDDAAEEEQCNRSRELRLDMDLAGLGYVTISAEFLDLHGRELEIRRLGGTVIDEGRMTRFSRRMLVPGSASHVRWIVEHRGATRAGLIAARVVKIVAH